jgi:hypothetical protein
MFAITETNLRPFDGAVNGINGEFVKLILGASSYSYSVPSKLKTVKRCATPRTLTLPVLAGEFSLEVRCMEARIFLVALERRETRIQLSGNMLNGGEYLGLLETRSKRISGSKRSLQVL